MGWLGDYGEIFERWMHRFGSLASGQVQRQWPLTALPDGLFRSPDELTIQGMWPIGPGFKFRMVLGANHEWMVFHFAGFDQVAIGRQPTDDQSGTFH